MDRRRRPLTDGTNTGEAEAASHGIARWLMSDAVLRPGAPGVGAGAGVVSWIGSDGSWDGLYPEICGYYLQFAAQAASITGCSDDSPFRSAASRVATWLDVAGGESAAPLTLYHRDMAQSDWRNQCLFAFDLAIILRGLGMAEARWPGLVPSGAIDRYAASVMRIVTNGRLASHRLRAGAMAAEVPAKWSTLSGVHHVKAAAALAGLSRPEMESVISATLCDEAAQFEREGQGRMRELHPFLYFIEGWLTRWGQTRDAEALRIAGRAFAMLLDQVDPRSGEAPPVANAINLPTRSDVLAQALRAGLVLEAAGGLQGEVRERWRERRPVLQAALLRYIAPEGAVMFDHVGNHRNSWASMFGVQALHFLALAQASELDPIAAAAALI